jgi:hypothetical protein
MSKTNAKKAAEPVKAKPAKSTRDFDPEAVNLDCDFKETFVTKVNDIYPVKMYVSQATGLEVLHVEVPGPVVSGFIVLGKGS